EKIHPPAQIDALDLPVRAIADKSRSLDGDASPDRDHDAAGVGVDRRRIRNEGAGRRLHRRTRVDTDTVDPDEMLEQIELNAAAGPRRPLIGRVDADPDLVGAGRQSGRIDEAEHPRIDRVCTGGRATRIDY